MCSGIMPTPQSLANKYTSTSNALGQIHLLTHLRKPQLVKFLEGELREWDSNHLLFYILISYRFFNFLTIVQKKAQMEAECALSWSSETQPQHPVSPAMREAAGREGGKTEGERASKREPRLWEPRSRHHGRHELHFVENWQQEIEISLRSSLIISLSPSFLHLPTPPPPLLRQNLIEKRRGFVWLELWSDPHYVLNWRFHFHSLPHCLADYLEIAQLEPIISLGKTPNPSNRVRLNLPK